MTSGRSGGGARSSVMSRRSPATASRAISNAAAGSGRRCCTGRMTVDASDLRRLFDDGWTVGDLVRFHSAHKLLVMAHSPAAYRALGSLVGSAASMARGDVERRYTEQFLAALASAPTRGTHANVL